MEATPLVQRRLIGDALLVSAATFFGYVVAFAYQAGYERYFGVPLDYTSVGIGDVILSLGAVISSVILTIAVQNFLFNITWRPSSEALSNPLTRRWIKVEPLVFLLFVIFGAFLWSGDWTRPALWFLVGLVLLFGLYLYVWPHVRHEGTYAEKLTAQDELERTDTDNMGWMRFLNVLVDRGLYAPLILAVAATIGAYYAGVVRAHINDRFPVVATSSGRVVVLKIVNNEFIGSCLVGKHHIGSSLIIWQTSARPTRLTSETLGPLTRSKKAGSCALP